MVCAGKRAGIADAVTSSRAPSVRMVVQTDRRARPRKLLTMPGTERLTAERGTLFASFAPSAAVSTDHARRPLPMTTGIGIDKASELTPRDFERLLLRTLASMKTRDFGVRMQ